MKTLSLLLQRYENSVTYKGMNKVNQSFTCKPDEIFSDYHADETAVEDAEAFDCDMKELELNGLIRLFYGRGEIQKIVLCTDKIDLCRKVVGMEDKAAYFQRQKEILRQYHGRSELLQTICDGQIERLEKFKRQNIISDDQFFEDVLKGIIAVTENEDECMEREFSVRCFGDSKHFEQHLKNAVCKQLILYSEYGKEIIERYDKNYRNDAVLACYQIERNPSYIYMKGSGIITLADKTYIPLSDDFAIAISSQALKQIRHIYIQTDTVMTIENLTSYHRLSCEGRFLIYLSGYHNHVKTTFLKLIARDNDVKYWRHFGDIDPDGFQILQNLKEKTGLPFSPAYMSIQELERYRKSWKKLNIHDRETANRLIKNGCFTDVLTFCVEHSCKLEQESISWTMAD